LPDRRSCRDLPRGDERIFEIRVAAHHLEKVLENTGLDPAAKPTKLSVLVAKSGRQIALR